MKIVTNILKKLHGTGIGKIWPLDLITKKYYAHTFKKSKETLKQIKLKNKIEFQMFVNPNEGHVDQQIFMSSKYELEITNMFCEYIKKEDVVLDIGANIGYFSLLSAKLVGTKGKVYAFEPSKIIFNKLQKNIKQNKLKQIKAEQKGCGSKNEVLELNVYPEQLGYSRINDVEQSKLKKIKEKIKIIKLDKYLEQESKISFIKIDVEGYEYEVINGLKKTINKFKPIIIFEFSPKFYEETKRTERSEKIISYLMKRYDLISLTTNKKIIKTDEYLNKMLSKQDNILCIAKK